MTALIPASGTRSLRLESLVNTVSLSATFQRLVGAGNPTAALPSIHRGLALDDGSMPFPRAIVRSHGTQTNDRYGPDNWIGKGEMTVFVQYLYLTDAQLLAWYSHGSGTPTAEDHRQHMENLFGSIGDEMRAQAVTAGCLEFTRLEEYSCGFIDPVTENGEQLVELVFQLHRDGLP